MTSESLALAERAATSYVLEQHIEYAYNGPVRNVRQRLIVVPPHRHGSQRRGAWDVQVYAGGPMWRRDRRDRFGNTIVDITVDTVATALVFDVTCEIATADDERGETVAVRSDPAYLRPTRLTAPDAAVADLAAGRADVEEICQRVHAAFTYEFGVTDVQTSAAEALRAGRGVCQDYAHVMIAACRLTGMAARYVSGHLVGDGGSHAWVEILRPTADGWVAEAWDPTHNRQVDGRYVTIAVGRDYRDVAPMAGTYESDGAAGSLFVTKRLLPAPSQSSSTD
jgi:transglutaminase-like putative cysteine protease